MPDKNQELLDFLKSIDNSKESIDAKAIRFQIFLGSVKKGSFVEEIENGALKLFTDLMSTILILGLEDEIADNIVKNFIDKTDFLKIAPEQRNEALNEIIKEFSTYNKYSESLEAFREKFVESTEASDSVEPLSDISARPRGSTADSLIQPNIGLFSPRGK